jgi:hypothetical protein
VPTIRIAAHSQLHRIIRDAGKGKTMRGARVWLAASPGGRAIGRTLADHRAIKINPEDALANNRGAAARARRDSGRAIAISRLRSPSTRARRTNLFAAGNAIAKARLSV